MNEGHKCSDHPEQTHEEWEAEQNEKTVLEQDGPESSWIAKCKVERGGRGYAWAGSVWKNKDCLLKKANAGLEDWQKWKHVSGEQGSSITIVQKKKKDGEGERRMTIHFQGAGSPVSSDDAKNESRNWKKGNKDKMLFETLMKKWTK